MHQRWIRVHHACDVSQGSKDGTEPSLTSSPTCSVNQHGFEATLIEPRWFAVIVSIIAYFLQH